MLAALVLTLALLANPGLVQAHEAAHEEEQRLPTLGAAPEAASRMAEVTLASLRGTVVAVTFMAHRSARSGSYPTGLIR